MARARSYRHGIGCRRCGSNWMPKDGHTRGRQVHYYGDCKRKYTAAAARPRLLPGAAQAAGGSDAHRGREDIGGGARSGRKRQSCANRCVNDSA